jgi:hypothetical protein
MSHSEKSEPTLPIRSLESKSEMAANTGLIANKLAQRTEGFGQAGGESVLIFIGRSSPKKSI